MSSLARHLVSQKKKRTVDKNVPSGSVDLDLSEIHKNIVCMGFPATGMEALYRNSYEDSLRYLDHKYGANYMVYNLCGEKAYQYSFDRFHGRVRCFPFLDHQACPLAVMPAFIKDATDWINGGADRVAVIHCKAGKGRTGIMACCLLIAIEPSVAGSAAKAIGYYGAQRTRDGRGLTVPSQCRSVAYYQRLCDEFGGEVSATVPTVTINEIRLQGFSPKVSVHYLIFTVSGKEISIRIKDVKRGESPIKAISKFKVTETGVQEDGVALDCRADPRFRGLRGDLKLVIKDGGGTAGTLSMNTLFLHPRYESSGIDKLNKKFEGSAPCAVEFDFNVTDGVRAITPPPSTFASPFSEDGGAMDGDEEARGDEAGTGSSSSSSSGGSASGSPVNDGSTSPSNGVS